MDLPSALRQLSTAPLQSVCALWHWNDLTKHSRLWFNWPLQGVCALWHCNDLTKHFTLWFNLLCKVSVPYGTGMIWLNIPHCDSTYRQHQTSQSDLSCHGSVRANANIREKWHEDSDDSHTCWRPILSHCPCWEMDVDVCSVQLFLQAAAKDLYTENWMWTSVVSSSSFRLRPKICTQRNGCGHLLCPAILSGWCQRTE